jgi:DNA adenine methylase
MKEEISMSNKKAIPFVKWAGGKRQLLDKISERLPREYNNYYEPFIGGGAVLFELQPQNAIINDINASLINAYRIITDKPHEFIDNVKKLDLDIIDGGKEYYYSIREQYNDKLMKEEFDVELASFFVFINKHCFNGLYRVNGKGLFNVPYNNSKNGSIDEEAIIAASEYLNNVKIMLGDFELACEDAKKGDFLFFDSPYAPLNPSSFESYTKEGFDVESHERLAKLFDKLTKRGCYCMLTNHNTDFINELYSNKGYKMDVVSVKRLINSDASKRTGEEIIICNY